MLAACANSIPKDAREFFALVRECALRVRYMEDLVAEEAERVSLVRGARGRLCDLDSAVLFVVRGMEERLQRHMAEYRDASTVCEIGEKLVARLPETLGEHVLRGRYLLGWDMGRLVGELNVSRSTVYNVENRAFAWIDENGLVEALARLRAGSVA